MPKSSTPLKERPLRRLMFWGSLSLFLHIFAFYLFQVVDAPPVYPPANRNPLLVWNTAHSEGGTLADDIAFEDPALFSRPPLRSDQAILESIQISPDAVLKTDSKP